LTKKFNSIHDKFMVIGSQFPNHHRSVQIVTVAQIAVAQHIVFGAGVRIFNQTGIAGL
jgi:hypothetical protein